ncbi:MAG: DegV family protein [Chloroflexi bacterium]|nr:DegV family protein [Chloroflexota bacterium]MBM3182561.1 DegV family protein [Chloroflexota bacterium]
MGNMAIVVDSACCLPEEIRKEYAIEVVPLNIHCQGESYQDGLDITPLQIYALQRADKVLTTSAPPPGTFVDIFSRVAKNSKDILCLSVASTYSATFSSMQSAMDMVRRQLPKLRIELIDCCTGSAAQALVALTAARAAKLGHSLNDIITKVQQSIPRVEISLVLDTLKYLERGGRAPKIGAWATSLLRLKPVVTNSMGHARLLGMVRSRTQGIDRLVKSVKEKAGLNKLRAIVVHSDLEKEARLLENRLHTEVNCSETYVTEVSAVVAAHVGPGAIGIAFCASE